MKRRVEAGDGRNVGKRLAHRAQRRQRFGLMQGGEIDKLAQSVLDRAVDAYRLPEALAAMHDPVPHSVGLPQAGLERGFEGCRIKLRPRGGELAIGQRPRRHPAAAIA